MGKALCARRVLSIHVRLLHSYKSVFRPQLSYLFAEFEWRREEDHAERVHDLEEEGKGFAVKYRVTHLVCQNVPLTWICMLSGQ